MTLFTSHVTCTVWVTLTGIGKESKENKNGDYLEEGSQFSHFIKSNFLSFEFASLRVLMYAFSRPRPTHCCFKMLAFLSFS